MPPPNPLRIIHTNPAPISVEDRENRRSQNSLLDRAFDPNSPDLRPELTPFNSISGDIHAVGRPVDRTGGDLEFERVFPTPTSTQSTSIQSTGISSSSEESSTSSVDFSRQANLRINAFTDIFGEDALILGHILFNVPPLAIKIDKQNIIYKWKSLRTKESSMVNSGNGECFIEINLAFVGKDEFNGPLSNLIVLWNSTPFCFIENSFIRKQMIPFASEDSMAVCLETLVLDAAAGMPDTIWATLQLRWFNYKPFSKHFNFRQNFQGANSLIPVYVPATHISGTEIPVYVPPTSMDESSFRANSFVNLTQLEDLPTLRVAYPPEVRNVSLSSTELNTNGIQPTNPVVYPFNSSAFMQYVERAKVSTSEVTYRASDWTDNVTLQWSSYMNIPWPSNMMSVSATQNETPVETETPTREVGPITPEQITSPGTRNIIFFVGDSITRGYLGLSGDGDLDNAVALTAAQNQFPQRRGYRYYALAHTGANSTQIKTAFLAKMDLTTPVNFAAETAFVVIAAGTNDIASINTVNNITAMVEKTVGSGAVAIILPIWPIGDDGTTLGQASPAIKNLLDSRNRTILSLGGSVVQNAKMSINTHISIGCAPERLNGAWKTEYRQPAPDPTQINLHPNQAGYRAIAVFVESHMPYNARTNDNEVYTVVSVLDGDTVDVKNQHDEAIRLRFQYVDCPEMEQISFGHEWGIESRTYMESLLPPNCQVQLRRFGSDVYGREIAMIIKNGVNINLKLVEDGKAVVYRNYCEQDSHADFYAAEDRARHRRLGVWESFPEHDGDHRRPWDYRHGDTDT